TLASPVVYGDAVTVAYSKPSSNPLQTPEGGQAASFMAQTVTNNRNAPPPNQPPVISISSPTKSEAFVAPATITIDADASDADGSVVKVEFYSGTTKLGERTSAPWSYTWKEVNEGSYSLTALAIDNSGSRTVSSAVTVVVEKSAQAVNLAPSITIASPLNNGLFEAPATITLTADASDPDGSISKVEYLAGGAKIGESFASPFSFTFQCDTAGILEIIAIAYDNLNATAISSPVTITFSLKRDLPELVNLYPSPNNGVFTIELNPLPEPPVNELRLIILSLTGKTVFACHVTDVEMYKNIDIAEAVPGIYIMQIDDGSRIMTTKRFVKF
ncbi:MAG: T9SS type A sorting domain-containing protein, partial [Spirochaetes bacterium]|nr:T9SS type A sorting domain-containing protein [Spirochaetota bacterium]